MTLERKNHHVVITPGVSTPASQFEPLVQALKREGMVGQVFIYPAREWTVDRAALTLATFVERDVIAGDTTRSISFVGVGTGSLITRFYLTHYEILPARRCVLVADPQHPSDKYRSRKAGWLARRRYGALLQQLADGPDAFSERCGQPPIPYGVIVTGLTLAPDMNKLDNTVIVNSMYTPPALLRAARDVIYCPVKAERIARERVTQVLVSSFLQHGGFTRD